MKGTLLKLIGVASLSGALQAADPTPNPMQPESFSPTWESLSTYQTPEWFKDAKFGIWAHWGPQCQPEQGDWYARNMYQKLNQNGQPNAQYTYHVEHYGPQSKVGFKDVINQWHAEKFDPEKLLALYKRAGAQYFMALANHHDNFDLWNSTYQPWNSVNIGPKRDLIGDWSQAARKEGLRFGVSVHAGRTWSWFEPAQGSDPNGPLAGVPYDGKLTKADGKGLWWDGLDPQDLYAQNHPIGAKPDAAYCEKFYKRTMDLVEKYQPDMIYFDDSVMPLSGSPGDYGLKITSEFYNKSREWHHGVNEAVVTTKQLSPLQKKCVVMDIERGKSDHIEPLPWQTDTCIGQWHYSRGIFDHHSYKKVGDVIPLLIDVVSKNGNLMLSIPLRSDGMPDEDELAFLQELTTWMDVNKEGILASRPWKVFGEGPSLQQTAPGSFGGQKEFAQAPYTSEDIRFTTSKDGQTLYAFVMAWPTDGKITIKSLAESTETPMKKITELTLLGSTEKLVWNRDATGLHVALPGKPLTAYAATLKLSLAK